MDKKYQVFVSSTFRDLVDERQTAIRNILDLGHIPAGMELFPAADTEQLTYIKKVIDQCDYYVLIMGGRYGSMDDAGVSFTEREYDYAVETGKTVLAFPHADTSQLIVAKSETDQHALKALETFRAKVMTGRLVREWKSPENLEVLVLKTLMHAISETPAVGWVRADTAASQDVLAQINQLRIANEALALENRNLASVKIVTIPDLAPLGASFDIHVQTTKITPRGLDRRDNILTLTWRDIFCVVGAALTSPVPKGAIADSLAAHLAETTGNHDNAMVRLSDLAVIERQLVALGLVQITAHATDNPNQYLSLAMLTDEGLKTLTELLAVRGV